MSKKNVLQAALKVLAAAMRGESTPEVKPIDLKVLGKELVANEKLTAKQYELIQGMDEEQQGMVKTLLDAMLSKAAEDAAPEEEDPEEMAKQAAAKAAAAAAAQQQQQQVQNKDGDVDAKKLDNLLTSLVTKIDGLTTEVATLKANQGKTAVDAIKRREMIDRLVANEASPFELADLEAMDTALLTKLEAKLRPADYSGQGQFASNQRGGGEPEGGALRINTGFLLTKPAKKKEAA